MTDFIPSISLLADHFDHIICDVWGVVHNGREAFPNALNALARLRQAGKTVVLLTNSPRPMAGLTPQLDGLKVTRDYYDAVISSGEITRQRLLTGRPERVYHLGPSRDFLIFDGIENRLVATPGMADAIICTGLFDDRLETPQEYAPLLRAPAAARIPMICANPDRVVQVGDIIVPCAGAIADIYEQMGGPVEMIGKPYPSAYDACFAEIARLRGAAPDPARVLAIGDGLITDIAGAEKYGLTPVFITGGIHADLTGNPAAIAEAAHDAGVSPPMVMDRLVWAD